MRSYNELTWYNLAKMSGEGMKNNCGLGVVHVEILHTRKSPYLFYYRSARIHWQQEHHTPKCSLVAVPLQGWIRAALRMTIMPQVRMFKGIQDNLRQLDMISQQMTRH